MGWTDTYVLRGALGMFLGQAGSVVRLPQLRSYSLNSGHARISSPHAPRYSPSTPNRRVIGHSVPRGIVGPRKHAYHFLSTITFESCDFQLDLKATETHRSADGSFRRAVTEMEHISQNNCSTPNPFSYLEPG